MPDLENITDLLLDYEDPCQGFWRLGVGVRIEFDRRKHLSLAVVRPLGGKHRNLKLPLTRVKIHDDNTRPVSAPGAPVSRDL
jgi:hypothetical protein